MEAKEGRSMKDIGAVIERISLGAAGFCVLIMLTLTGLSEPLDLPLRISMWLACLAIPLLLSVYIAKDDLIRLRRVGGPAAERAAILVALISYCALFLFTTSLAAVAGHFSPILGVIFLLLTLGSFTLSSILQKLI